MLPLAVVKDRGAVQSSQYIASQLSHHQIPPDLSSYVIDATIDVNAGRSIRAPELKHDGE